MNTNAWVTDETRVSAMPMAKPAQGPRAREGLHLFTKDLLRCGRCRSAMTPPGAHGRAWVRPEALADFDGEAYLAPLLSERMIEGIDNLSVRPRVRRGVLPLETELVALLID